MGLKGSIRHSNSSDFTGSLLKIHTISWSPDFYQILSQNVNQVHCFLGEMSRLLFIVTFIIETSTVYPFVMVMKICMFHQLHVESYNSNEEPVKNFKYKIKKLYILIYRQTVDKQSNRNIENLF
jgi:hypothetical protein